MVRTMKKWAGPALATLVAGGLVMATSPWVGATTPFGHVAGTPFGHVAGSTTSTTISLGSTPLLSVRRDPTWIESNVAAQRLEATLAPVVSGHFGGSSGTSGCVEVRQGSTVLFSLNGSQELMPASALKLLTDTALLDRLGSDYKLTTKVVATAPASGGVVRGNLYLVGGGDPLLMTDQYVKSGYMAGFDPNPPVYTSLNQLAAQVKAAGVRVVTGSIVGDDSRFDQQRSVPTWQPVYIAEGDVAPLSALEVDDDIPPTAPRPATTTTSTTVPKVPPPKPPPPDPPLNAAGIFASLLRQEGVVVDGGAATGPAPGGSALITQIQSPPLAAEVESMLRISDDTAAELLTKELGYVASESGTTSAGTAAVRSALQSDGLPVNQLVNLDGSGLDRGDRVTCSLLDDALVRAGASGVLAQGLPIAGKTGTLIHRLIGTSAAGRLEGKTGTLEDVATLSGFITAPATAPTADLKAPLVFTIIVNGPNFVQGQLLVDKIAVAMASYPDVPPLSAVSAFP
jgi:D-alanyl-D-alanine carboxypeptidase/D-alanyl-D-alanine-endopeptidase (penicillin-binding protein 4)